MAFCTQKQSRGFTLTELAIVLAIVGIVLGAIWVAAAQVFAANKANQATQDITTIVANIRSTFLSANSFSSSGDQTTAMVTAGILPSDLLTGVPASPVKNAWNGAVKVTFNPSSNARVFRVSFLNTPADACFRIASQLANIGTSDAPINLITNGGTVTAIPNLPPANVGLSSQTISTLCNANTGSASASTEFDYNIH